MVARMIPRIPASNEQEQAGSEAAHGIQIKSIKSVDKVELLG
jgi:hypothetical protein